MGRRRRKNKGKNKINSVTPAVNGDDNGSESGDGADTSQPSAESADDS
jgi:hypothetical protein